MNIKTDKDEIEISKILALYTVLAVYKTFQEEGHKEEKVGDFLRWVSDELDKEK